MDANGDLWNLILIVRNIGFSVIRLYPCQIIEHFDAYFMVIGGKTYLMIMRQVAKYYCFWR